MADEHAPLTEDLLQQARSFIEQGLPTVHSVAQLIANVRRETLEEVACFAETHYCVIDWERGPQFYKTEKRESKHPHEPFAMAIRALAQQGAGT